MYVAHHKSKDDGMIADGTVNKRLKLSKEMSLMHL